MLYVFHGSDIAKSVEKAHALIASLRAKRLDASFIEISADKWSQSAVEENLGGQGLFSGKYIIFLNRVTENVDAKESLPSIIQVMNESANIFIVLEGKLNAELKRAVEKDAEKTVESEHKEAMAKKEFNVFALADAFGRHDAVNAWKIYREAIDNGVEPENIAGILFWKAKSMSTGPSSESDRRLEKLVTLYHDGHRGILDLERGIEKLLLSC
jgi:DNA polymerase III delta subunit